MHRRLRYQTVRQWDADDTSCETSATQEEEVPVEASRLGQGELLSLSGDGRDVVIVVK